MNNKDSVHVSLDITLLYILIQINNEVRMHA